MSIQSEINRIAGNVSDAFDAIELKGVTVPSTATSDDLATLIGQISGGGVSLQAKTNINPTTSSQTITADAGYDGLSSVQINAMPSGSATPAANITGSGASVTVGTNTITLSKTISNTPQVTAGYVSSGTAGNSNVSLVASVNTRSSSDLTISGTTVTAPAGYYSSAASATVPVSTITVSSSNPTGGNNGDVWIKTS